ncbi:MAG TPA: hypothetical protein VGV07_21870 [Devosia sp.]|jgi:hypothetical protein|uniref:hypothetical protein n=1 Tax=Devosia sp. TaxID=1871048 RepID=UPI002DDD078B|nr:hypothetical protein [Devosia sp.]HEV2517915.1 hypothetical protein [Devosia sp.]
MLPDLELQDDIGFAYWWTRQMVGQLHGDLPWLLDPGSGDDAMTKIRMVDALRIPLQQAGVAVPAIVDPDQDPIGNMIAWRDFLATMTAVH